MDKTPSFCRVKIAALGQLDTTPEDADLLGATVVTWTGMEESDDIFAEVEIRGIVTAAGDLWWLSGDAQVEVLEWARYAGQPEDFIASAPAMKSPAGVNGSQLGGMTMDTPAGWPELNLEVHRAPFSNTWLERPGVLGRGDSVRLGCGTER